MGDFIDDLLQEIHLESIGRKEEAEKLLKKLSEEGEKFGWIKLFEMLK